MGDVSKDTRRSTAYERTQTLILRRMSAMATAYKIEQWDDVITHCCAIIELSTTLLLAKDDDL